MKRDSNIARGRSLRRRFRAKRVVYGTVGRRRASKLADPARKPGIDLPSGRFRAGHMHGRRCPDNRLVVKTNSAPFGREMRRATATIFSERGGAAVHMTVP